MATVGADMLDTTKDVMFSGFNGSFTFWLIVGVVVLGSLFGLAWLIQSTRREKAQWTKKLYFYIEDPLTQQVSFEAVLRKGAVTYINGQKQMVLNKAIGGKILLPMLNHSTRPDEYRILLTSDNRITLMLGMTGFSTKRQEMDVRYHYPDIDYEFEQLNKQYAEKYKVSTKGNLLGILEKIAKITMIIGAIVLVIIALNYWDKNQDKQLAKDANAIAMLQTMDSVAQSSNEGIVAMTAFWIHLEETMGKDKLRQSISEIRGDDVYYPVINRTAQ